MFPFELQIPVFIVVRLVLLLPVFSKWELRFIIIQQFDLCSFLSYTAPEGCKYSNVLTNLSNANWKKHSNDNSANAYSYSIFDNVVHERIRGNIVWLSTQNMSSILYVTLTGYDEYIKLHIQHSNDEIVYLMFFMIDRQYLWPRPQCTSQ